MELLIVVLIITVITLMSKHDRKVFLEDAKTPRRNIPIQYAYTIDEWYGLRCKFDSLIEDAWQLYKNEKISAEQYKSECDSAVKQIIPLEFQQGFKSLYQWGARNAAIRVAQKGYMPGIYEIAHLTTAELREFNPTEYVDGVTSNRSHWMKCIPGEHSFLDLYPDPKYLEYMGCGVEEDGKWYPINRPEPYSGIYYTTLPNSEEYDYQRGETISYFYNRGFNGICYVGEPVRSFGNLTEEEIKNKYEFLVRHPLYNFEEYSAICKCVRDPNRVLEENLERSRKLQLELEEGRRRLKELEKNG